MNILAEMQAILRVYVFSFIVCFALAAIGSVALWENPFTYLVTWRVMAAIAALPVLFIFVFEAALRWTRS